jgi:hypothetical protein
MPKSAMTMSDYASLVGKRMFSGLSKRHTLHTKTSQENDRKAYLRSRWTMSLSCRYFTPAKTELVKKSSFSVSHAV